MKLKIFATSTFNIIKNADRKGTFNVLLFKDIILPFNQYVLKAMS